MDNKKRDEEKNFIFLQEMNLNPDLVNESGLSIERLRAIAKDYEENQLNLLDEAEYIAKKIQRCTAVHSVRWRIKNTAHMLNKIIRKVTDENSADKYKDIDENNYKSIITDLIGVRAIYLFKSNWIEVHNHILSRWKIKNDEKIMIYHRDGDIMDIYDGYDECSQEIHKHNYRSIHYIVPATNIKSVQVFCEIQTRTIFEEGWSEIDHQVRYPNYSDDDNLMSYLNIFNRLAGSADEMGSYVNDLVELIKENKKLEEERDLKEKVFNQEKERLDSEIKSLSNNQDNFAKMQDTYNKLIKIQSEELSSLKDELKSKNEEPVTLNRLKSPVSKVIEQDEKSCSEECIVGEISVKVLRENDFASFGGRFSKAFKSIPNIIVTPISTTAKNTSIADLKVNTGVGKASNFNAHLFNTKLRYVEEGEYRFSYVADLKKQI